MKRREFVWILLLGLGAALALLGLWRWRAGSVGRTGELESRRVLISQVAGMGVNTDLLGESQEQSAQALNWAAQAGFTWVRQKFLWSEIEPERGQYRWEQSDAFFTAVKKVDLNVLPILIGTPIWARADGQENQLWSPPAQYSDYGDFVEAFAARYGSAVDYYEIWEEANIYPHWGDRYVEPEAYAGLLREAATRIHSADASAKIVMGGLAPNTENGPLNLNEMEFIRRVWRAGGGQFCDVIAIKPYGFMALSSDAAAAEKLNFQRAVVIRETLDSIGAENTPVWAVEFGWNALPDDWQGKSSPWGNVSQSDQIENSTEAVSLARHNWPWLGMLAWPKLTVSDDVADPSNGFALLDEAGNEKSLASSLLPILYEANNSLIGSQTPDSPLAEYSGDWRVNSDGADPSAPGDSVTIRFSGTAADVEIRPGPYWAIWYVTVDGQQSSVLPQDQGKSYIVLYDPLGQPRKVPVARGLSAGEHVLRLEAQGGWGQWPLAGWRSWQESTAASWTLPVSLLGILLALYAVVRLYLTGWLSRVYGFTSALTDKLPIWMPPILVCIFTIVFWLSRSLPISAVLLLALALIWLFWPSWGVATVAASLPFFMVPKHFGAFSLPVTELFTWLLTAMTICRVILTDRWRRRLTKMVSLDLAVCLFVTIGVVSLLWSGNYGVAVFELRKVVINSALLYLCLRLNAEEKFINTAAVAGLLAGSAIAAAIGIGQYLTGKGLIQAGSALRVRSFYGSPNNLALYIERVLPLAAALVLSRRGLAARFTGGLIALLLLICGVLTRSRGLVLIGMPVMALVLVWRLFPKGKRYLAGIAVVLALILVVALGGSRIRSLLSGQDEAAGMRLPLWRSSIDMIIDHPLTGVGLDNFLYQYRTHYILPEAWQEPNLSHPHNLVLDFWARLGIGGLLVLLWFLYGSFRAIHVAQSKTTSGDLWLYVGIEAALLASVAHGLVDNFFFLVDLSYIFMFYLALVANNGGNLIIKTTASETLSVNGGKKG